MEILLVSTLNSIAVGDLRDSIIIKLVLTILCDLGNPNIRTAVEYQKALLASLDVSALDKPHFQLENLLRRFIHESNPDDTCLDDGGTTLFQHRQTHYHMLIFKLQRHTFGIKSPKKSRKYKMNKDKDLPQDSKYN
ncbi:hypothetical protein Tco_1017618 [Tanacetum coccineum]|uniref:Uncharacterized protein n=1 Tax=Tanacetum coccineum TaxID=301880 RepID=A0ABQ5FTD8_9ASTR